MTLVRALSQGGQLHPQPHTRYSHTPLGKGPCGGILNISDGKGRSSPPSRGAPVWSEKSLY